jgi:hypothetical protein
MAADWVADFTKILDSATGVVQAAANVVNPTQHTTVATSTPPQGETTPKQAQVAYDTSKPSAVPWGLVVGALVVWAVLEW